MFSPLCSSYFNFAYCSRGLHFGVPVIVGQQLRVCSNSTFLYMSSGCLLFLQIRKLSSVEHWDLRVMIFLRLGVLIMRCNLELLVPSPCDSGGRSCDQPFESQRPEDSRTCLVGTWSLFQHSGLQLISSNLCSVQKCENCRKLYKLYLMHPKTDVWSYFGDGVSRVMQFRYLGIRLRYSTVLSMLRSSSYSKLRNWPIFQLRSPSFGLEKVTASPYMYLLSIPIFTKELLSRVKKKCSECYLLVSTLVNLGLIFYITFSIDLWARDRLFGQGQRALACFPKPQCRNWRTLKL